MKIKKDVTSQGQSKKSTVKAAASSELINPIWILLVLLITFIAYIPALKAGFVNWDDGDYTFDNMLIRNFSRLKELIITPVQGNMHPLTMISLAVNYAISGNEPWSYHLLNVLLHVANTFLAYRLALKLSIENAVIALTTSLLFGLHPMHVESVAWVAERKDVLYGFFFLLGLISYTKYVDAQSKSFYFLCLLWFLLSLASKPAAVIFPVTLFTIDLYRKRKLSLALILEKIPFFIFAALIGYFTVHHQTTVGATDSHSNFQLSQRIFFPFYGFLMYIVKLLLPLNLVTFYPFPAVNAALPVLYYIAPVFFLIILILCIRTFKNSNVIAFGFSFYFVNLLLILQFFIVGSAIIAERYTYIPYIGLFYIMGWLLDKWQKHAVQKALLYLGVAAILLSIMTYKQASVWISGANLWDHAIAVAPSFRAYNNRAMLLRKEGNNDKALEYYNAAIKLNHSDAELFCNRGNIYFYKKDYTSALNDYNKALSIRPGYPAALDNRAALYGMQGKYDIALIDLNEALKNDPKYKSAYANRGIAFMELQKYNESIADFYKFLEFTPDDPDILNSIGVCYQSLKEYEKSIPVFTKIISINPKPVFYMNRSYSWNAMGKLEEARKDAIQAKNGGMAIPEAYGKMIGM